MQILLENDIAPSECVYVDNGALWAPKLDFLQSTSCHAPQRNEVKNLSKQRSPARNEVAFGNAVYGEKLIKDAKA